MYHHKYRRIQKPDRHNVPHPIPKHTDKSQQRSTYNNAELLPCPTGWEREGGRSGFGTLRSPSLALTALKCDLRSHPPTWQCKKTNFTSLRTCAKISDAQPGQVIAAGQTKGSRRGKSGLHRAGCRITSGGGNSQTSATEINRLLCGVRVERQCKRLPPLW